MIIRRSSLYTNKQKRAVIIISSIIDLIILVMLIITIAVMFIDNWGNFGHRHLLIVLLSVFCMLPFSDLFLKKEKAFLQT